MQKLLALCLLIFCGSTFAHGAYGTWPDNDQADGQCKFSDWSRFAWIKDVYDGDTVTGDIDMGFHLMWVDQKIRFYGVNAHEIRNRNLEEKRLGLEARDWLRDQILHKWTVITTHNYENGKFGRKLATICRDGKDIIVEMIDSGRLFKADY